MYERVMLATDMHVAANDAAAFLPLVTTPNADVSAITIVPLPDIPGVLPEAFMERLDDNRRDARQALDKWAAEHMAHSVHTLVHEGQAARILAREASAHNSELIVLGATHKTAVERLLLGSHARAILRRAPCDALVVHRATERIDTIVVATDFQGPSRLACARAQEIATACGARVVLTHVSDLAVWPGDPAFSAGGFAPSDMTWLLEQARVSLSQANDELFDGKVETRLVEGRPGTAIRDVAAEVEAQLIILGGHGGGPFARLLMGSVAEHVAIHADTNVLIVRGAHEPDDEVHDVS